MKTYNLKPNQYEWLLDLAARRTRDFNPSYELREGAYNILKKCGYNREYNEDDRTVLIHMREMYIGEKKNHMLDYLPF